MLEKLPRPLRQKTHIAIFQIRIRILPYFHKWQSFCRKLYRLVTSTSEDWEILDLSDEEGLEIRQVCITLIGDNRFEERRKLFRTHAKSFGWPVVFWPAINGAEQNHPDWVSRGPRLSGSTPLTQGEIGLLMTTKEVYQWAWEEQLEFLVIFEDDAVIHGKPILELPKDFDIVFLNNRFSGDLSGQIKKGWGTDGYVISRRGLNKMLNILQYAAEPIDLLIMMHIRSLNENGHYITKFRESDKPQLECFHVGPLVTHASFFDSSIHMISQ